MFGGGSSTFSMMLFEIFLISGDFEMKKIENDGREPTDKKLDKNILKTDPECRKHSKIEYLFFCHGVGGGG